MEEIAYWQRVLQLINLSCFTEMRAQPSISFQGSRHSTVVVTPEIQFLSTHQHPGSVLNLVAQTVLAQTVMLFKTTAAQAMFLRLRFTSGANSTSDHDYQQIIDVFHQSSQH